MSNRRAPGRGYHPEMKYLASGAVRYWRWGRPGRWVTWTQGAIVPRDPGQDGCVRARSV